jgi:hypothetical protein
MGLSLDKPELEAEGEKLKKSISLFALQPSKSGKWLEHQQKTV